MKKISFFRLLALCAVCILPVSVLRAQWNTNTSVNINISSLVTADMESASTSDAKTWVAFYHQNGSNYDMRAQLFDADGNKLLGDDGVLVSNQNSGSAIFVFNVCVDASNNLVIACQDERSGPIQAVMYKISQTGTHLWDPSGIILGEGLAPFPALLSNGEIAVAWIEGISNTLKIQKITTSGTKAWTTPVTVMVGSSRTTRGQLIGNPDGRFTMVYQKQGYGVSTTLYAQQFDNDGTALYAPVQICSETSSAARYYSIAAEGDTTYFGYYTSVGFRFNSYLQRINPGGAIPWGMNGSNFSTATGTYDNYQGPTNINLAPGSPYVWSVCTFSDPGQNSYGIYIQKFLKTSGARQLTDYGKVVYSIGAGSNSQEGTLALVDDTPMFMFYDASYKIYATRLDEDGNFSWPGNQVEISSTATSPSLPKGRFAFSPDGPDRCAGFWVENRGSGYLGYAQGVSVGGLIGITVETQGGVLPEITVEGGTLQMVSTVFPAGSGQEVTWSILPGTGQASIDDNGLVTAIADGTVWAKAEAVQDPSVKDSLMITISNQINIGIGNDPSDRAGRILVYPVPCNGIFSVETVDGDPGPEMIRVYTPSGMVKYDSGRLPATGLGKTTINLRPISSGVYFVEILTGNAKITRKIIVQN